FADSRMVVSSSRSAAVTREFSVLWSRFGCGSTDPDFFDLNSRRANLTRQYNGLENRNRRWWHLHRPVRVNDKNGETRTAKVLGTKHRLVESVLGGLKQTGIGAADVAEIGHGSTTATNALIERTFPAVAMITTEGFRDTIEIGRQRRERLYDPYQVKERPLIPRRLRLALNERMSAQGEVVRALDEAAARAVIAEALGMGAETFAVCFINA